MTLPYRWYPAGTTSERSPAAGALVAHEHQVWRVVSFTKRPRELWSDEARAMVAKYGSYYAPYAIVLRPLDAGDDPKERGRDVHLESRGYLWDVYPHEHYPVCASCQEPLPCRERVAEKTAREAAEQMGRFETPGVCPACQKLVSARQKSLTFPDNLEVPGGPPVTFHVGRYSCRHSAADYEKRWVAADPERRKATLSCAGGVTRHNDGTYECTEFGECPGPQAEHRSYTVCACPDCHASGPFDCHPTASDRLLERTLPALTRQSRKDHDHG